MATPIVPAAAHTVGILGFPEHHPVPQASTIPSLPARASPSTTQASQAAIFPCPVRRRQMARRRPTALPQTPHLPIPLHLAAHLHRLLPISPIHLNHPQTATTPARESPSSQTSQPTSPRPVQASVSVLLVTVSVRNTSMTEAPSPVHLATPATYLLAFLPVWTTPVPGLLQQAANTRPTVCQAILIPRHPITVPPDRQATTVLDPVRAGLVSRPTTVPALQAICPVSQATEVQALPATTHPVDPVTAPLLHLAMASPVLQAMAVPRRLLLLRPMRHHLHTPARISEHPLSPRRAPYLCRRLRRVGRGMAGTMRTHHRPERPERGHRGHQGEEQERRMDRAHRVLLAQVRVRQIRTMMTAMARQMEVRVLPVLLVLLVLPVVPAPPRARQTQMIHTDPERESHRRKYV